MDGEDDCRRRPSQEVIDQFSPSENQADNVVPLGKPLNEVSARIGAPAPDAS